MVEIEDVFVRKEDFMTPTVVTFLDSGILTTGAFGKEYIFRISDGKKEGKVSFWRTHIVPVVKAYGKNTTSWVGQRIILQSVPITTKTGKPSYAWLTSVNPSDIVTEEKVA